MDGVSGLSYALYCDRHITVFRCAIAELSIAVTTPTVDFAGSGGAARMVSPGANRGWCRQADDRST